MKSATPAAQAKIDGEKSKTNSVKTLSDLTPEEREVLIAKINSTDRSVAQRRAAAARRGKH